jgi:hypothetical protein
LPDVAVVVVQVPIVVKVPMAPFQSVLYNWVKASGTIRLDPDSVLAGRTFRTYAPLNNKCMELRKVSMRPPGRCLAALLRRPMPRPRLRSALLFMRACLWFSVTANRHAFGKLALRRGCAGKEAD